MYVCCQRRKKRKNKKGVLLSMLLTLLGCLPTLRPVIRTFGGWCSSVFVSRKRGNTFSSSSAKRGSIKLNSLSRSNNNNNINRHRRRAESTFNLNSSDISGNNTEATNTIFGQGEPAATVITGNRKPEPSSHAETAGDKEGDELVEEGQCHQGQVRGASKFLRHECKEPGRAGGRDTTCRSRLTKELKVNEKKIGYESIRLANMRCSLLQS